MFFESFSAFVDMGGHGFYVWVSYLLALVLFVFNVVVPVLGKKQYLKEQQRRIRREQQMKTSSPAIKTDDTGANV